MNELDGVEGGGSKMGNSRVITTSTTCRGSPDSAVGKESACNAGDPSSIPGLGRSPGEGLGYPSMDCVVQGVTKSSTQLSDFHFLRPGSGRPLSLQLCKYQEAFSV